MISAKAILPGRFDPDAFSREIIAEMARFNRKIENDFRKTIETWDHKPNFKSDVFVTSSGIVGHVRTARIFGRSAELIYYFISQGTQVRYAKMTKDFQPKTRVRVIGSFPGVGGLDSVDARFPMPGIVGRKFNEAIADKHRPRFVARINQAIKRGAIASGHAFK